MKIEIIEKEKDKTVCFMSLKRGECFYFSGEDCLHIKTNDNERFPSNAVCLNNEMREAFLPETVVIKAKMKIIWEK